MTLTMIIYNGICRPVVNQSLTYNILVNDIFKKITQSELRLIDNLCQKVQYIMREHSFLNKSPKVT